MSSPTVPRLVNATGRPQFVIVDGRLVQLRAVAAPAPVEAGVDGESGRLTVRVDGAGSPVQFDVGDLHATCFEGPPVLDGVVWLVDGPVMNVFAHRADFVRVGWYRMCDVTGLDVSGVDPDVLADRLIGSKAFVVGGLSRSRVVVDADAVPLTDLAAARVGVRRSGDVAG